MTEMKTAAVKMFRRLAKLLLAGFLLVPGALSADEPAPPSPVLATVAASGNLMNIAVYDALLSAGAGEFQARAAAMSVADTGHFATKSDLAELKSDLIQTGMGTAGAIVLIILAGFHLLWRRISELAERLPRTSG